MTSIQITLGLTAYLDLKIEHLDIKTIFLHGEYLDLEIEHLDIKLHFSMMI